MNGSSWRFEETRRATHQAAAAAHTASRNHSESQARLRQAQERSRFEAFGKEPRRYDDDDAPSGPVATIVGAVFYLIIKVITVAVYVLVTLFAYFFISGQWPAVLQRVAERYL